ncbi:MAG TPA: 1,4-alpha-glucan branching protein GlgB [Verrucomicrobiae bacterium]|jgi:1,4-alpha-glucan branching enzyme|nr:1,4-alpha-glucan branching protein GlgB [Verrucomicrobiae bacterium]
MILTNDEADSLIHATQRSPHTLLGMHKLGDGSGLVVRVLWPKAVAVEIVPVHEKNRPSLKLAAVRPGLFEASTKAAREIYAYDVVITEEGGRQVRQRDAYSFLPTLGETDLYLFAQGNERRIYEKLGAHARLIDGVAGVSFAVWAPEAQRISVVGVFNHWDGRYHALRSLGSSGIWEIFVPGVAEGAHYKFEVRQRDGNIILKTDPYGFFFETPPKNASIVWDTCKFAWTDNDWMARRPGRNPFQSPLSIYEVHLGSWMKKNHFESLSYREVAQPLAAYVQNMGFTHVEFMPIAEHAFYPSWGYQVTGFYSPTSRFGTPDDFQYLVNELHRAGIGVIIDWVPAHFPRDDWALARFDGTALYEHADPRKGAHQDWGTLIFNYGRHEVRNFLVANALFWCDRFHIDGLRVDAVASMLYLDYSRKAGEWVPNIHGGRENLEAVEFIKQFNHVTQTEYPGVITIAEESTAWPQVTRPPYLGGLGFTFKWNMGWMHDTLNYFERDPIYRKYHQNDLTFAMVYAYHENFILPLSHDEIVHGKGSLLGKMPGDEWQKFANLRALLAFQWLFPGKQLLMMSCELGQGGEWNANASIDWWLLDSGPYHRGVQRIVRDLNRLYRDEPALWDADYDHAGFYWIDCGDADSSVLSFARRNKAGDRTIVVILNLTPTYHPAYRVGLPAGGFWREVMNSDSEAYAGTNKGNYGGVQAEPYPCHHQPFSASFVLPPLSVIAFRRE